MLRGQYVCHKYVTCVGFYSRELTASHGSGAGQLPSLLISEEATFAVRTMAASQAELVELRGQHEQLRREYDTLYSETRAIVAELQATSRKYDTLQVTLASASAAVRF